MDNAILAAVSRQDVLKRQLDVVAHNIANMNSVGFKQRRVLFEEYVRDLNKGAEPLSMVQDFAVVRDMSAGSIVPTGNQLDTAIEGDGYFSVETPDGERFTRAGRFALNETGELVNSQGYPVLSEGSSPIAIPPEVTDIQINTDGTISGPDGVIDRIKLSRFENENLLKPTRGGLFRTDERPIEATESRIHQGMVEQSNVQAVLAMTEVIEITRQYQSAAKLVENEHERELQAIRKLGKLQ